MEILYQWLGGMRLLYLSNLFPHLDKYIVEGTIIREGLNKIGMQVNQEEGVKRLWLSQTSRVGGNLTHECLECVGNEQINYQAVDAKHYHVYHLDKCSFVWERAWGGLVDWWRVGYTEPWWFSLYYDDPASSASEFLIWGTSYALGFALVVHALMFNDYSISGLYGHPMYIWPSGWLVPP